MKVEAGVRLVAGVFILLVRCPADCRPTGVGLCLVALPARRSFAALGVEVLVTPAV